MKKTLFLLFFMGMHLYALVSVKPVEINDTEGLDLKALLSLETKYGNSDKQNYSGALRLTYHTLQSASWAEVSTEYGKSNDTKDTDKAFLHLRHIHASILEDLNYELFGQVQDDSFKLLKNRTLLGGGFRYKLFTLYGEDKGFFGLGLMDERISYTSDDPSEVNQRVNSYLAYTSKLSETSRLSLSFYYQPKINDFSDHVTATNFELELSMYGDLSLMLQVSYDTDSNPPLGIKRYDLTQKTSFLYKF